MRYKIHVLLAMLVFLAPSCKEAKEDSKSVSQMDKVMAVHDEVMPKMSTISKLVGELKPKIDSTDTGMAYEKAMVDLQEAHTSMMDWMRNFGDRFNSEEILEGKALSEEKQAWLDEEEDKVKALKEQINGSIARAEALLNGQGEP